MFSNLSYWERDHYFNQSNYIIIGSGIVGLNAGIRILELEPGADVLIIEQGLISSGASTKNAGFACFGSPSELIEDLTLNPPEQVFSLFEKRYSGIHDLLKRNHSNNIDYQKCGGYEVFDDSSLDFNQINQNIPYLNSEIEKRIQIPNYFQLDNQRLKHFPLKGFTNLIATPHEGVINPMKLINQLAIRFTTLGGKILNGLYVNSIEQTENKIKLNCKPEITLQTSKVLIAVNGFTKHFFLNIDVIPARNQVLVIKPERTISLNGCFHFNKGYVYFRTINGHLLIGGGRNLDIESENTISIDKNPQITNYLINFVKDHILLDQKFEITDHWSGIMGLGPIKSPIIKLVNNQIGLAVRLGGMGVAIGTRVGIEGAEMIINSTSSN